MVMITQTYPGKIRTHENAREGHKERH